MASPSPPKKTLDESYKPYLCRLLVFIHGGEVDDLKNAAIPDAKLRTITPEHVARWLTSLAYGTPDPSPMIRPTRCRSSLLAQAKKAISYYMPNKDLPWEPKSKTGNPTKSEIVNNVITDVKKKEAPKPGKSPKAKQGADAKRQATIIQNTDNAGGSGVAVGSVPTIDDQLQTVLLALYRLEKRQEEQFRQTQASILQLSTFCRNQFELLNRNMAQYSSQPIRPLGNCIINSQGTPSSPGATTNTENAATPLLASTAKLSRHPRSLLKLWHEYLYGLDGNKPARDFTAVERGQQKFKYSRRMCFWRVMSRLINAGFNEKEAIEKIQQAYGAKLSVSAVIDKIRQDKKNGGHPNLTV